MHTIKVAIAIALLLVPAGAVVGAELEASNTAVEQHTSYVQLIAQDGKRAPGFAAMAGIVSCQPTNALDNAVLWFNDEILFRQGHKGPDTTCVIDGEATHVWAVEDHAPDPRGNPSLAATGETFEFTDPNGLSWTVVEYVYHQVHIYRDEVNRVSVGGHELGADLEGEVRFVPYYTWVVEVGTAYLDPTLNDWYNFVTVIDFSKLQHGPDGHAVHSGQPGDVAGGNSHNASDPDEEHRFPHTHREATIDLYAGGAPEEGEGEAYHQGARVEPTVLAPRDIL